MENLEEVALKVYEGMFGGKRSVEIEGNRYSIRPTSKLGLRVVYAGKLRFLEQNPEKASHWGEMAREGHRIMWIIEDGDYVGQVRDGEFHDLN